MTKLCSLCSLWEDSLEIQVQILMNIFPPSSHKDYVGVVATVCTEKNYYGYQVFEGVLYCVIRRRGVFLESKWQAAARQAFTNKSHVVVEGLLESRKCCGQQADIGVTSTNKGETLSVGLSFLAKPSGAESEAVRGGESRKLSRLL